MMFRKDPLPLDVPSESNARMRRLLLSSILGNALEWYDFFLYATAAGLVFGPTFFPPEMGPTGATLSAFGVFAVGFIARPLGGVLFGHVGDRYGRRIALLWTLAIMGAATCLIGLLPSYAQIGMAAPVLLVVLRILQGIAAGGEWSGGVLILSESADASRRGYLASWSQVGVGLGLVLASATFWLVRTLPGDAFMHYGWRVPFVLSLGMVWVGALLRRGLIQDRPSSRQTALPVLTAIRKHSGSIAAAIALRVAENGGIYLFTSFSLVYAQMLKLPQSVINALLSGITVGMLLECAVMPMFGALSDRIGRLRVYGMGACMMALLAWPFFHAIGSGDSLLSWLAFLVTLPLAHGAMIGVQPSLFSEMFGAEVRYVGVALGHEIGSALAGGLSPIIATLLYSRFGGIAPVIGFMATLTLVTLVALAIVRRRAAESIGHSTVASKTSPTFSEE